MVYNLLDALELLEREKGVPADTILDALANALVSAYKRTPGAAEEARVTIAADTGEILVHGQELDEDGNVVKEWEDTPENFGRIAAQTAKQVIRQRLRDAKREQVFDIYEGREGDLITGIVQQSDHRYAILDLGDAEAIMPSSERIPYERLERGNRVKAYILEVRGEGKGPQIVVSRSHPEFIRSLFELEVPELVDGDAAAGRSRLHRLVGGGADVAFLCRVSCCQIVDQSSVSRLPGPAASDSAASASAGSWSADVFKNLDDFLDATEAAHMLHDRLALGPGQEPHEIDVAIGGGHLHACRVEVLDIDLEQRCLDFRYQRGVAAVVPAVGACALDDLVVDSIDFRQGADLAGKLFGQSGILGLSVEQHALVVARHADVRGHVDDPGGRLGR